MNVEAKFESEKNLILIARQAVLQEWTDDRPIRKPVCPHCESVRIGRRMHARNGCEYICRDCRKDVSEEDMPKCCPAPGKYVKCQHCFHFQRFTKAVKQKVQALRDLTPEERAAIVAAPGFYQFEQPKPLSQEPMPSEWEKLPLADDWSSSSQLSLFENADKPLLDDKDLDQPK